MLSAHMDFDVVGHAENGVQGVASARDLRPDIMVMDVGMPELGGIEATRCIRAELPNTKVIALSMHSDWRYVAAMLDAGAAGYVLKDAAYNELASAIRTVGENREYLSPAIRRKGVDITLKDLTGTEPMACADSSLTEVVREVIEARDPYTANHQRRVAQLSTAIATELGMSDQEVGEIRVAALVHDVGKISVPAEILSKPGMLSLTEFALVKKHAETGYRIISSANIDGPLGELVFQHHERCDGSGYPRGLSGDEMLLGAKVLAVADVVEAMASHRPYRASLGLEAALQEIEEGAGGRYDAAVVASCVRVFADRSFVFDHAQ